MLSREGHRGLIFPGKFLESDQLRIGVCVHTYGRPVCDAGDATFRGTFREFHRTFRERFASFTQGSTHVSRTFRGVSRMSPGQAICSLPRVCGLPSTRKVCYLIFVHSN